MTTMDEPESSAAPSALFLDTNILVYASWAAAPLHQRALALLQADEVSGVPLVISRQILREFLAVLTRPQFGIALEEVIAAARAYAERFQIVDDDPAIFTLLLTLVGNARSKRLFDANIVATMVVAGVPRLLTNNPLDFTPFADLITVETLEP